MDNAYRVLIVDDDEAQAEMAIEFLNISGFTQVDHAYNVQSLWKHLEHGSYDIVLLDYMLPDGTGLEVLNRLAEQGRQIPVVMVTGQGDERVAVQAIQSGAADYLMKSGDYLITLPSLIRKTVKAHQLQLSVQRSLEQVRYQALLLSNVRDAVVVWDMEEKITYWNPAAVVLFGWEASERLGQPVGPAYLSAFSPPILPPKKDDSIGQHVIRKFKGRDGKIVWVSSRVSVLRDLHASDRLIGYMDVSHDITRRVQAEQALKESEARYRAIVEDYQTELICRFKPNGALTFVNEVYCRYFGKSREALLGTSFLNFVPEGERHQVIQHLINFNPAKPTATMEHRVNLPGQGIRWLQRTDRAIFDQRGRIFEFQSVGRDVTDRKLLESQIQAAQSHLVQAARLSTIGEIASGVAHQIYNPLTTIIADAQILLRNLPADHKGHDSAEAIEQAGWRLQQVVQRLMEFSRPTSEALTSLSINETIQSALSLVSAHIETTGCRLEAHLNSELPSVVGSSRQLENLWVSLLLLARDASTNGRGQTIRIVSKSDTAGNVIIEVWDDGEHIPLEHLASIFEPNFIGPTSGRGTGMELSICREIVRQHHGHITAESSPEAETVFRVTLPAEV